MRLIAATCALQALGNQPEAEATLQQLVTDYGDVWPYNIAYVCAYRGEVDRAFQWLNKAVELRDSGLSEIYLELLFGNLHGDPRWRSLLESLGKSPAQLNSIHLNIRIPRME